MKQYLKTLVPFVVAVAVIVSLMPREGKFKYEFQKGKEWKHRSLVAAFDFPLYKTNAELQAEKRTLLNAFSPFYRRDTTVAAAQVAQFSADFLAKLQQEKLAGADRRELRERALPLLLRYIAFVYAKGIREDNAIAESYLDSASTTINIVTNHFAEMAPLDETFLTEGAARYIHAEFGKAMPQNEACEAFLQRIDIAGYLLPNLWYSSTLTAAAQAERLSMVSPTMGIVNKEQRLISHGELVNEQNFRELESYRREYERRVGFSGNFWLLLLGQTVMVCIFIFGIFAYLLYFHEETLTVKNCSFFMLLVVLFFVLSWWIIDTDIASLYVIPFAMLAIFIFTFFNHSVAMFVYAVAVLLAASIAPNAFEFIFLTLSAGVVVTIYARKAYHRRSHLYLSAMLIFAVYCLVYLVQLLIKDGGFSDFSVRSLFWFFVNAVLIIAGYQLIFAFEKIFGFISDNTLIELADTNQPLLRSLAEKAPATFQHCVQVASLAETAVDLIGGNPLLVRAGALYHDVGKSANPLYFIENKTAGYNPHQNLEPEESAKIIIKHVPDGVSIARKNGLPKPIIDFIITHHGMATTRYFAKVYKERNPEATDFSQFTYPGPNPGTKEQAVLMLADAVEAASRASTNYSSENLSALVESVVATVINDKVLDESPLTFADINTIKAAFKKKLQNVYHDRITVNKE